MNRKKHLLILGHLVNKNIKLYQKLIDGDKDLIHFLEEREMRKGLKYCSIKNSFILNAILARDAILIKKHLRVSVEAFQKLVELFPAKRHGYNAQIELGVILFWLAAGMSYRIVNTAFNIPITSVYNIVQRTMDIILSFISKIILLPRQGNLEDVGMKFANRAGSPVFDKAVGALDGTHIKIKCPTGLHSEYINRKLDYSIQLQAICDADHKFLDICVGWPGSVHDQRVLRNSDVYLNKKYPPQGYFLLGDSGYQLMVEPIAVITPFTKNSSLTCQQKKFNHLHSKARIAIEQAFGEMKTRWRCIFLRALEINIKNCKKVIAICCMLHNICLDVGDLIDIDEEFQNEINIPRVEGTEHLQTSVSEFRNQLCANI